MQIEVIADEQVNWYEASLPLNERKKRGHFSTPPSLVSCILDACGYTADVDLSALRVLDPACGSGNFLAGAAGRLVSFAQRAGLSTQEAQALVARNIWGFDPDPISCFLAEMQVRRVLNSPQASLNLHIHQADSLTLSWEPCVDLFLANPPYLAAKNNDLSGYRSAQQRGQVDSYLLFLALALQVVRPGGWMGLVLPDPVLARANATPERAQLLASCTIQHLWHLSGVFAAEVGAVVLIAQKSPAPRQHLVCWSRERWRNALPSEQQQVRQELFQQQPGSELRYLLSSERGAYIERLRICLASHSKDKPRLAPLGAFLAISRGEEIGRESGLLVSEGDAHYYPVLRGGLDIRPFCQSHARWYIAREAIRKPLERYLAPKLLVVKSTDRLQATLDLNGHVALQALYLLHLRDENEPMETLYFYLALLNSRLLRDYVYFLHTAYKWVQPQIEQRVLANLPVPIAKQEERQQIIELALACSEARAVVELKQDIPRLQEALEQAIYRLYDGIIGDNGVVLYE